jgi:glycosyltransferase involved in cell wall biosynthesis
MSLEGLTGAANPDASQESSTASVKVCYLHGRPGPHPMPGRLAAAVGADFQFVDFRMPWQAENRSRLYTIMSWLVCAATLPRKATYNVFLVDNLHISPVLMKRWFLRDDQKIVVHLASHTLYFLLTHRFAPRVERLHLWALRNYDALICEGQMTAEMARTLLGPRHPPIYESFIGPPDERLADLSRVVPDLESRRLVFIGSGPNEFRMHYKGLDLMLDAFSIASAVDPTIEFDIVGAWDPLVIAPLLDRILPDARRRVHFRGEVDAIAEWLARASLCLHCTRGDAFPTSTLEAMTAGVVPLVSEWTGTRQVVAHVSDRLIAPLEPQAIAERIFWYFGLDSGERARLSDMARAAVRGYTESAAKARYQAIFAAIYEQLGVARPVAGIA